MAVMIVMAVTTVMALMAVVPVMTVMTVVTVMVVLANIRRSLKLRSSQDPPTPQDGADWTRRMKHVMLFAGRVCLETGFACMAVSGKDIPYVLQSKKNIVCLVSVAVIWW